MEESGEKSKKWVDYRGQSGKRYRESESKSDWRKNDVKRVKVEAKQAVTKEHKGSGSSNCGKCGKPHPGECRFGTRLFYKFGKPGHIGVECKRGVNCNKCGKSGHMTKDYWNDRKEDQGKEIPKVTARAFSMTKRDARK